VLVDRRLERGSGLLALDERERDAVHEQHLVGHDALAALGAGDVDAELRDHDAVVGVRLVPVLPVDVVDPLIPAAVPAGQALDGGAVEQQVSGLLVGFEKARGADTGERGDGLADPRLVEPRPTMLIPVDDLELCPEPVFEDDFAEAGTAGFLRIDGCWRARRSAFEVRPAMFLSWSISGRSTSSYSGPSVIYFACFVPACAALFGPAVMAT
jgi:hypothetical protein